MAMDGIISKSVRRETLKGRQQQPGPIKRKYLIIALIVSIIFLIILTIQVVIMVLGSP